MAHTPTYRGTGVGTGFQKRSCANKNALLIDATVDICVAVADGLAKDACPCSKLHTDCKSVSPVNIVAAVKRGGQHFRDVPPSMW
jgi:hypothetical protein